MTVPFTIPAADKIFPGGVSQFGVQVGVSNGASFPASDIYVDDITVCGGETTCSGTASQTYDWETAGSIDGWALGTVGGSAPTDTAIAQSTDFAKSGSGSLKVSFTALPVSASATSLTGRNLILDKPNAFCGQVIEFNIYTPAAAVAVPLNIVAFSMTDSWATWKATADNPTLTADAWNTISLTLPSAITFGGLQQVGLQVNMPTTGSAFTGNIYIDGVTWQ